MNIEIPTGLPTLSQGMHYPDEGHACVMEYVALLAGEEWTDRPKCTHPVLAEVARGVNDRLSDEQRQRLVPLIGRLFGTAEPECPREATRLASGLVAWAAERAERAGIRQGFARASWRFGYPVMAIGVLASWEARNLEIDQVAYLADLLDEYDRLTGRTEHREVTDAELALLAARVEDRAVAA